MYTSCWDLALTLVNYPDNVGRTLHLHVLGNFLPVRVHSVVSPRTFNVVAVLLHKRCCSPVTTSCKTSVAYSASVAYARKVFPMLIPVLGLRILFFYPRKVGFLSSISWFFDALSLLKFFPIHLRLESLLLLFLKVRFLDSPCQLEAKPQSHEEKATNWMQKVWLFWL